MALSSLSNSCHRLSVHHDEVALDGLQKEVAAVEVGFHFAAYTVDCEGCCNIDQVPHLHINSEQFLPRKCQIQLNNFAASWFFSLVGIEIKIHLLKKKKR